MSERIRKKKVSTQLIETLKRADGGDAVVILNIASDGQTVEFTHSCVGVQPSDSVKAWREVQARLKSIVKIRRRSEVCSK